MLSDWKERALCKNADSWPFFCGGWGKTTIATYCQQCPVQVVCFWDAMANEERDAYRYGIWGGATTSRRDDVADALGHPSALEYERRRDAALVDLFRRAS